MQQDTRANVCTLSQACMYVLQFTHVEVTQNARAVKLYLSCTVTNICNCSISSDIEPTNFSHIQYFCYLNYTPSVKVSQAAIPVNGSQSFILRNALYWIKIHVVVIEICQIKI